MQHETYVWLERAHFFLKAYLKQNQNYDSQTNIIFNNPVF
jgi:hypothetical protein